MPVISFSDLPQIIDGRLINISHDRVITSLITDSRKAANQEGSVFFAMRGDHHDGHQFIEALYQKGIRQFVVEQNVDPSSFPEANILLVESTLKGLQQLVAFHRSGFELPVIGITGSNGKTIVKEWLFQLLSPDYKIAKNPGSYNSQLGVPLSVWEIRSHHEMGIFEAGISKPGEMEKLGSIIQPTLGIFTNIGTAHDEGFPSVNAKIDEKLKLFESCKMIFYCEDHSLVAQAVDRSTLSGLSWGFSSKASIQIKEEVGKFIVSFKGISFSLVMPFSDPASIENCMHCVTVLLYFGYSPDEVRARIQGLQSVPMRLELKEGINQTQIIDDTYNSDLGGLRISLEFLANQHQKIKKTVILSDILESGLEEKRLVQEIASLISQHPVNRFIGIGKVLASHPGFFPPGSRFFNSTEEFISDFDWNSLDQEMILVKGARIFQFEKIVEKLQRKVHGTIMEIDLGAVVHNLNYFKSLLKPRTKIMVMVKAFAYGSGSTEIANLLQYHKTDYLGVAYADEGIELRKNNISLPVMVMNPTEESFGSLLQFKLEPEIYSFKILHSYLNFLGNRPGVIHLKLDTGMHRLGFEEHEVADLIPILRDNKHVKVASIFSHLAGADEETHDQFSNDQAKRFTRIADDISQSLGYKPLYHILNSPGILRLPDLQMDMVRLGIGLYGVDPTANDDKQLQPVATLKTIISQIKHIKPGETVGYGRRGKADKPTSIATIAVGYADGYSRSFSRGSGKVLINGALAPVIGNVCMDMTMVDITGIDAREGDEVIIFGDRLPIQQVATWANTIPYEILTQTSERVKRVFVAESI